MRRIRRLGPPRLAAAIILGLSLCSLLWCAYFVGRLRGTTLPGVFRAAEPDDVARPPRMSTAEPLQPLAPRVHCYGPRGKLLNRSHGDTPRAERLLTPYPPTFSGSYHDLGLEQTWLTAAQRYGPYGYGEDSPGYPHPNVDWAIVDWAALQNSCFDRNAHRFPSSATATKIETSQLLAYPDDSARPDVHSWRSFSSSRRTAIVLRAYDGFLYTSRVMAHIRSLIVETALLTGGEYSVILLVHIRNCPEPIFASTSAYDAALRAAGLPAELHTISVLWDDALLETWYPLVAEHRTMWQVYQPLQLLAHFLPAFDHYWQLELDVRFTSDAGALLDALARFSTHEPRKQALERASWLFLPSRMGSSYAAFLAAVNRSAGGGSHAWGPLAIPDVAPVGPAPPTARPHDDDFAWGVGEEAAVVVTSLCADGRASARWTFRDWVLGFAGGGAAAPPCWFCPPAVQRAGRTLLHEAHRVQVRRGLAVPSEATLVSLALWHGLKISFPPLPTFVRSQGFNETLWEEWSAGGPGPEGGGGERKGFGGLDPQDKFTEGMSWWWTSTWAGEVMEAWCADDGNSSTGLPFVLATKGGRVYAPGMALHPVKEP